MDKLGNQSPQQAERHENKAQDAPKIPGSPDIILRDKKVAIFVHGCFWHKCPKCYREPKSNKEYWLPKIKRNVRRDERNAAMLRRGGWKVVKLWEHEINGSRQFNSILLNRMKPL